jgi:diadenylate cyclase
VASGDDLLRSTLAAVAPGTALRDGLERILRGNTGALIVLGHDKVVEGLSPAASSSTSTSPRSGCASCPRWTAPSCSPATSRRSCAPACSWSRPDDRHRGDRHPAPHRGAGGQADRLPRRVGQPVDAHHRAVRAGHPLRLDDSASILSRANQALATSSATSCAWTRWPARCRAEIEDLVTVRDAMAVSQRLEMVRRIATEIEGYVVELGTDGRLLSLQLEELMAGVEGERELVVRDYLSPAAAARPASSRTRLPSSTRCRPRTCSTCPRSPRPSASRRPPTRWRPPSAPAATACWPRCRACRAPS